MSRSLYKGPYVEPSVAKKVEKVKSSGKREVIKTYKRASTITPDFVGLTFAVHDGRKFSSIFITENMVGHRLGEFVPTRTFRVHSGQRKAGEEPTTGRAPVSGGAPSGVGTASAAAPAAETAAPDAKK